MMDADTRSRYKVWVWKKIFRRVIVPSVLLLTLLIGSIFGLRMINNDNEDADDVEEGLLDQPAVSIVPTYQDFDFSIYNENEIVEVDPAYLNSYLVLINKVFRLPENFSPQNLVVPEVFSAWGHDNTNHRLRETAARALEDMFRAAYEDGGLTLWITSGYRTFEDQADTYRYFVDTHGLEEAENMSARPGHSEHQTGLVADVTAASVGALLVEEFSNAPEGVWLRENAHRFGFIIRYPDGRMDLTGFGYEPWHIRYVGIEAATYIFENDIVLEQYIFPHPKWEQP